MNKLCRKEKFTSGTNLVLKDNRLTIRDLPKTPFFFKERVRINAFWLPERHGMHYYVIIGSVTDERSLTERS